MAASWDLRRLQQSIEKKPPESLYLLHGDEAYLVGEALKTIREKSIPAEARDFNYDQFFVGEVPAAQVRDTVEMLPMMSDRRLVLLRGVEGLKEKDWDALMPVLESPFDSCTFVLVAEKVDKRKKYFKKISENGITVELKRPYDNQVPAWIEYIAFNHDLELSRDSVAVLQQLVGGNLGEINSELAKLSQFLGSKRKVESEDILQVVSRARIDSVFDLTDAIGRNDRSSALVYLANLLEHGQNEVGALALVLRHIRIISALREGMNQGLRGGQLAARAGVPGFFLKQYMQQCSQWSENKIRKTMEALHRTDMALKSSPLSSHIWLENFIVQTCTR